MTHDSPATLATVLSDSTLSPKQLGSLGERYAAAILASQGWRVLERNWRTRFGELDLIMLDPTHVLVFVEVKTRRTLQYGLPQEAVTHTKRLNLRRAAMQWLCESPECPKHRGVRFDVVSIAVSAGKPRFTHIEEAF